MIASIRIAWQFVPFSSRCNPFFLGEGLDFGNGYSGWIALGGSKSGTQF